MRVGAIDSELKLDLEGTAASTVREWLTGSFGEPTSEHHLISTYFDTADGRLWKAGVTFRVRKDGERYIQTIKADEAGAAGLFNRPEWEHDISGRTPDLDAPTAALLSKLAGHPILRKTLRPRFTTDIARELWRIEREGADLEIASDDGEIRGSGRTISVHELEIELKGGPKAALFHLAGEAIRATPARIGVQSKAERGHGLSADHGAKAPGAEPITLADDLTAATGFQAIALGCLRRYRLNEARFLRTPGPEGLHQCRVALRRMRSSLDLFKPLLDDAESNRLSERLREAALLFSQGRNVDVVLGQLDNAALAAKVLQRREQIYADLLASLRSSAFRTLLLDLTVWISGGAWLSAAHAETERNRPIKPYAAHALGRYRRQLKRRGKHLARLDAAHRHKVRIAAKKLRYAAEFFEGLFPGKTARRRYKRFLRSVERLQTELGALNDQAMAAELLEQWGLGADMASGPPAACRKDRPARPAKKTYGVLMDLKPFWA